MRKGFVARQRICRRQEGEKDKDERPVKESLGPQPGAATAGKSEGNAPGEQAESQDPGETQDPDRRRVSSRIDLTGIENEEPPGEIGEERVRIAPHERLTLPQAENGGYEIKKGWSQENEVPPDHRPESSLEKDLTASEDEQEKNGREAVESDTGFLRENEERREEGCEGDLLFKQRGQKQQEENEHSIVRGHVQRIRQRRGPHDKDRRPEQAVAARFTPGPECSRDDPEGRDRQTSKRHVGEIEQDRAPPVSHCPGAKSNM